MPREETPTLDFARVGDRPVCCEGVDVELNASHLTTGAPGSVIPAEYKPGSDQAQWI